MLPCLTQTNRSTGCSVSSRGSLSSLSDMVHMDIHVMPMQTAAYDRQALEDLHQPHGLQDSIRVVVCCNNTARNHRAQSSAVHRPCKLLLLTCAPPCLQSLAE